MHNRWSLRRRSTWALAVTPVLAVGGVYFATASPVSAHNTAPQTGRYSTQTTKSEHFTVKPNSKYNMTDCNGWSPKYHPSNMGFRKLCTDPHGKLVSKTTYRGGKPVSQKYWSRFEDNGHYVGHDEPSVKFISSSAHSGNTMTYFMQVPHDPARPPTNNGKVTHYSELTGAAWLGLPLCDPASYPQNPCTPDSDSNSGLISDPNAAGSAFMELQWYPPGFTPFQDNTGCSTTKWCVAMTIDSVASQFNFKNLNLNCQEPVNFAYLTDNGVPGGPPSPQLTDGATYAPTSHTLEMSAGDVLKVQITDPSAGFTTTVTDITTGKTGTMTASAANGFMNTNYLNCNGSPFTFHAEYATAAQQNQVPWAAAEGGVLMEQEIGHNENCTALLHKITTLGAGLTDKRTFETCVNGNEGHRRVGEGGCNFNTGVCHGAETEGTTGPIACASNNFASGQLCEYSDGTCLPQGNRTTILNGVPTTEHMPINFCQANATQNGDLDFDGISYRATSWPNGTSSTPTSFRYAGPFDAANNPYPTVQFESDAPGSEFLCNLATQFNCQVPPLGAKFYPYWTMTTKSGQGIGNLFANGTCIWNFGNTIKGVTTQNFGKDAQYGAADFARFGGTTISAPAPNPEISGSCPTLTFPS